MGPCQFWTNDYYFFWWISFVFFSSIFLLICNRRTIQKLLLPFHLLFFHVDLVQSLSQVHLVHLQHLPELFLLLFVIPLVTQDFQKAYLLFLQSTRIQSLYFWVFPQICQILLHYLFRQLMLNTKYWSNHLTKLEASGQIMSGLTILWILVLISGFLSLLMWWTFSLWKLNFTHHGSQHSNVHRSILKWLLGLTIELLGENGIIWAADQHACSECSQPYKKTSDAVSNDPTSVIGVNENQNIPHWQDQLKFKLNPNQVLLHLIILIMPWTLIIKMLQWLYLMELL